MIAKQTVGRDFHGILAYVSGKSGARLIAGNMAGQTMTELLEEFRVSERLNAKVERPVYHVSLALPACDTLLDQEWRHFLRRYLDGMGFSGNQYVGFLHTDTDDVHVHAIASRIRIADGRCVRDSWNYRKSERLLRELEGDFGLTPVASSRERKTRAPKTGEVRFMRRTGEESVRVRLQHYLKEAMSDTPTRAEFTRRLAADHIEARYRYNDAHTRIVGASFALDGIAFTGNSLGQTFSWPSLESSLSSLEEETEEALMTGIHSLPFSNDTQANSPAPTPRTAGARTMKSRKQLLRTRYLRCERIVRERLTDRRIERRAIDVAIALLVVREHSDLREGIRAAQETLTQGEGVDMILARDTTDERRTHAERYIQEVTDAAMQAMHERQHNELLIE